MDKRGLSQIISTIIIILIVIIAVLVVWGVVANIIKTQNQNINYRLLCSDISLELVDSGIACAIGHSEGPVVVKVRRAADGVGDINMKIVAEEVSNDTAAPTALGTKVVTNVGEGVIGDGTAGTSDYRNKTIDIIVAPMVGPKKDYLCNTNAKMTIDCVEYIPQCSDGIDNDNDGKIDLTDPECASAADNSERKVGEQLGLFN